MYTHVTEAEWKVMKVLWEEESPLNLKEIVAALKEETNWSNTTVRTLIVRLMEKGLIDADKSIGYFKYYPIVKKEACQMKEAKNFLDTIFEGSMGMLITAFANKGNLSDKDKKDLMRIIEKMEEEKDE